MYHNADIAILDDPLAAVDAHVGKHLFRKCILDQLLNSKAGQGKKTVVLVTNALQYLNHPMVDRIVVFQNGRVVEQGTYKELAADPGSLFQKYLAVMGETGVSPTATEGCDVPGMPLSTSEFDSSIDDDYVSENEDDAMMGAFVDKKMSSRANGDLMTNEFKERAVGKVDSQVYFAWARAAGGSWLPFLILAVYGLVEVINVSSKWWLTYCTLFACVALYVHSFHLIILTLTNRVSTRSRGKPGLLLGHLRPFECRYCTCHVVEAANSGELRPSSRA